MGKKLKLLIIGMLSLLVPILLAFAISLSLSNNRELGRDTSAAASTTMKLITYNVLGIGLDSRIQEIADYIEKESPDVIALQEMHWEDNQNRLKTALESRGLEYYSVQNAHYQLILSKNQIEKKEVIDDGGNRWITTFITEVSDGKKIRVFHVHPEADKSCIVVNNLANLVDNISQYPEDDVFLLGDFNMHSQVNCYPNLIAASPGYVDSCWPDTEDRCDNSVNFMVHCAVYKPDEPSCINGQDWQQNAIDHVFYKNTTNWTLKDAYIDYDMDGSDHFPVVAIFVLDPITATPSPTKTNTHTPVPSSTGVVSITPSPSLIGTSTLTPSPTESFTLVPSGLKSCGFLDDNQDGEISILDFGPFKSLYSESCAEDGDGGGCGSKDSNSDGVVDIRDFVEFISKYGGTC